MRNKFKQMKSQEAINDYYISMAQQQIQLQMEGPIMEIAQIAHDLEIPQPPIKTPVLEEKMKAPSKQDKRGSILKNADESISNA